MPNEAVAGLAVVTGAASGIGFAIGQGLLAAGWRVVGLDIGPAVTQHARYRHIVVDLCDAVATRHALHGLDDADALVHAAGLLRAGPLARLDPSDGECMWKLHVDAAVRLAQQLIPRMAERGAGRVVLVGSRVAQGMSGRSQYAASKAALLALARSWAAEFVAQGVTVNVVAPAATQTGMLNDPARLSSSPRVPPVGRLIQPEEIAALVAYLLSPPAAVITGQEIVICGGASLPR